MSVVLLVEDDRELREMMTLLLDSCGIGVRTASNGLAALM
jgi:CheY-like chemotaxis protein